MGVPGRGTIVELNALSPGHSPSNVVKVGLEGHRNRVLQEQSSLNSEAILIATVVE